MDYSGVSLFFLLIVLADVLVVESYDEHLDEALDILEETPLLDGHNDFIWKANSFYDSQLDQFDMWGDMKQQCQDLFRPYVCHTDIPRLKAGKVGALLWVSYIDCFTQYKDATDKGIIALDTTRRMIDRYPEYYELVTSADGILAAHGKSMLGSIIGVEGGHMMSNSMAILRTWYRMGARFFTLTHNCNTPWADYRNAEEDDRTPENGGLTEWGRKVVVEMNRLGMIIDLSHTGYNTRHHTLDVTLAPVIFSHSNVFSICGHRNNVPDDILLRLKLNGGMLMINFLPGSLNCTGHDEPGESANIATILDHMEYIRDLIGIDHVGIGSDFDGTVKLPDDLDDISQFPNLVAGMLDRGWPRMDIDKVLSKNFIRVFEQVEQVRNSLTHLQPDDTPMNITNIPPDEMYCLTHPWDAPLP